MNTVKLETPRWAHEGVVYHLFPLGTLGAPGLDNTEETRRWREQGSRTERTLRDLIPWVDHAARLGATIILLGPVTASSSHGYDTVDLYRVDDRLGTQEDLRALIEHCHLRGLKVVLDAVLNHVGRDHGAFRELQTAGRQGQTAGWFRGLDWSGRSPYGDHFAYEGWAGHFNLAALDHGNREARDYLLGAVTTWLGDWNVDGLRLDAADCLPSDFVEELMATVLTARPDAWVFGELVHGDYRQWLGQGGFHGATNYELYKGLWSSFNEGNFFELAWTLGRQFGPGGIYRDHALCTFLENHDVARIASTADRPEWLGMLYGLMFALPGVPGIYYGGEWAIGGKKEPGSDRALRPCLDLAVAQGQARQDPNQGTELGALGAWVARLAGWRRDMPVLRDGALHLVYVSHLQLVFARVLGSAMVLVMVNTAGQGESIDLSRAESWKLQGASMGARDLGDGWWVDVADQSVWQPGRKPVDLPANGFRLLSRRN